MNDGIKINLKSNFPELIPELMETVRSFGSVQCSDSAESIINIEQNYNNSILNTSIFLGKTELFSENREILNPTPLILKRYIKRMAKLMLYKTLSMLTGRILPWGSLTGIRPAKLAYELIEEFGAEGIDRLDREYLVSPGKVELIKKIINTQKGIKKIDAHAGNIFINIPFCVSRCSYCSFPSALISEKKKLIGNFVGCVIKELTSIGKLITDNNYKVRSVYVGGGTPTSLDTKDLETILSSVKAGEFTVEAGRPDTITQEKLEIMKKCGVTRLSINPQTFKRETLIKIGRNHSADDILRVYDSAKNLGFIINMDLIMMLPDETEKDMLNSLNEAVKLKPGNITIHTLAIKRGSILKNTNYENHDNEKTAEKIINESHKILQNAGYNPYYLYRQKYMSGNLENTGYALPGKECLYNIDIMEETTSVFAAGAGGISKKVTDGATRIERYANIKGIEEYISRIDEIIENREKLFTI